MHSPVMLPRPTSAYGGVGCPQWVGSGLSPRGGKRPYGVYPIEISRPCRRDFSETELTHVVVAFGCPRITDSSVVKVNAHCSSPHDHLASRTGKPQARTAASIPARSDTVGSRSGKPPLVHPPPNVRVAAITNRRFRLILPRSQVPPMSATGRKRSVASGWMAWGGDVAATPPGPPRTPQRSSACRPRAVRRRSSSARPASSCPSRRRARHGRAR